jgi:hypothetical protein
MKRFCYIVFCLLCAAGGVVLGRYALDAPVSDAPVTRPSAILPPRKTAPQSVEESIASIRSGPRRAALIISLAARGGRRHLPALIAACAHDDAALQLLGDVWLQTDPGAFVQALAASKAMQSNRREQCATALHNVIERWGIKSPDDAWQCAESLRGNTRRMSLSKLAGQRIKSDARAGLEFLKSHPGVAPDDIRIPKENSASLLPLVLALPESAAKSRALAPLLRHLPLAEAIGQLSPSMDYAATATRRRLLNEASANSLEAVIAFHGEAAGANRYDAARFIGEALVNKDPAAAAAWAQDHLSGDSRTSVLRKAADALKSKDPAAAEAVRALLPENYRPGIQ